MRRPILVGGLALSLGLWGLDSLGHAFSEVGTTGLIAIGGLGWWWYQRRQKQTSTVAKPLPITPEAINTVLAQVDTILDQCLKEAAVAGEQSKVAPSEALSTWVTAQRSQVSVTRSSLEDKTLNVLLLGGSGVGKTALLQLLQEQSFAVDPWHIHWSEAPALFNDVDATADTPSFDPAIAHQADLVLLITAGDLTDSEYQVVQTLEAQRQPFCVVLNKTDQYLPADQDALLQQIQYRLQSLTDEDALVAIAAHPNPVKVRRHQASGSVEEWLEQPEPTLSALTHNLTTRICTSGQQFRWATALRIAETLKQETKAQLNQLRCDRALPIIENYQWISAGAAFVNPLPALDLLATAAVSTQMVMDLGSVYQQKVSLDHAQTIAGEIAKLLVKLGVVELASQAIASTLKTNVVTYVAGGTLQGVSAAYLTRLAGLSLIDYFQAQEVKASQGEAFSVAALRERLTAAFQVHQKALNLQQFVTQSVKRLLPEPQRVSA